MSLFGDWFNTMAVFAVVEALTGSPLALGLVVAIKLFGFALFSIPGGLVADRLPRKALMVGADLSRAVIVLGFLLVEDAGDLPLLYILLAVQVGLGAVFDPASRASLPNITSPTELLTANALQAASWSTLLAVGAAVGGVATAALGADAIFVVDSATYLVSAACVARVTIPQTFGVAARGGHLAARAYRDLVDGWAYLHRHPRVGRVALAKTAWAVGGGGLVYLLTLVGGRLTPQDVALGIGILYSARGVGTGVGPILARRLFRDRSRWPVVLGACVVTSALSYLAVGLGGWGWGLLVPVLVAHAASGANWVLSTVLLQERVEDVIRGRVFGAEMVLLCATEGAVTLAAAGLVEAQALSLSGALVAFSLLQLATGALWLAWVPRRERREAAAGGGAQGAQGAAADGG